MLRSIKGPLLPKISALPAIINMFLNQYLFVCEGYPFTFICISPSTKRPYFSIRSTYGLVHVDIGIVRCTTRTEYKRANVIPSKLTVFGVEVCSFELKRPHVRLPRNQTFTAGYFIVVKVNDFFPFHVKACF